MASGSDVKNMEKSKKIMLWIFLAMFLIPELLWSPILNIIFNLIQNSDPAPTLRPNFLINSDNFTPLLVTLAIQIIGLVGSSSLLILSKKIEFSYKTPLIVILFILLLIASFIFMLIFGLRHGIGF